MEGTLSVERSSDWYRVIRTLPHVTGGQDTHKSLHQLCCPPHFVAVADHLPPPDALLLRHRCLHCHATANFIDAPPLPSSLHRRFCLLRRAAVAFIIPLLLIVAPPLPLSSRRRSLPRRAAAPFLVVLRVLPLSTRCHCLRHRAAAPFVVAPPFLPLSSHRRCPPRRAAAAFIVAPPFLPSSSGHRFVPLFAAARRPTLLVADC